MMRYWEIKGDPEGRRFCFTTEPLLVCPHGYFERVRETDESGALVVTSRQPTPAAEEVARILGTDVKWVTRLLERGHGGSAHHRWRDPDGRLTKQCASCGAKMIDHGYSAWVERDKREDEFTEGDTTSAAIAGRLGFDGPSVRLKQQAGLKRSEARQWAHEQFAMAKAAVSV